LVLLIVIKEEMAMKTNFSCSPENKFIQDYNLLVKKVEALRVLEQRIVVTIGTWDMLHKGHARYLVKAKEQGDILVVGADSDGVPQRQMFVHSMQPVLKRVSFVAQTELAWEHPAVCFSAAQ